MSDAVGEDIVAAVRSVRRFTEDVGKLLATTRDFLEKAGWKSRTTQAISVSTSLNLAHNWLPQDAFWFVFNELFPNHLLVVSVVFDSIQNPKRFKTPVVMAGFVRFSQPVRDEWQFRWSRLCEKTEAVADGEFREVSAKALDKSDGIERAEIAVRPLTSITGAEALERLVLEPLLSRVGVPSQLPGA